MERPSCFLSDDGKGEEGTEVIGIMTCSMCDSGVSMSNSRCPMRRMPRWSQKDAVWSSEDCERDVGWGNEV